MGGLAAEEIRPLFLQSSLNLNNTRFELGAFAGWACSSSAQGAPGPQGMRLPFGTLSLLPSPCGKGQTTETGAGLCFPNETMVASLSLATFG